MQGKKVLLTGVTGFLGSHTTIQLLEKGYKVIGTLRNIERTNSIKKLISKHTKNIDNLAIVEANLNNQDIWLKISQDVDFIQHIASPFPRELPKKDDELIIPAKSGVLNVLHAAVVNKVKRVVVTSSMAAIAYGKHKEDFKRIFDETDWTDETNLKDSTPYFRSKTIAEKAAWKFISQSNSSLELSTVLPGAILGPVLENDYGTSANIVIKSLDGTIPAVPKIGFDIIDVRSVADLLIRAMELPQAANNRYIASSGYLTFKDVAGILKKEYPDKKIPSKEFPDVLVKLFSNFDKTLKPILIDLSVKRKLDNTKAIKELNWKPIPIDKAVLDCAKSVIELGIVK